MNEIGIQTQMYRQYARSKRENGLTLVSAASGIVKLVLSQHTVKASSYLLTYATE